MTQLKLVLYNNTIKWPYQHKHSPVPARYVRQSQMCPQLDMSDKNDQKGKICPTKLDVSDKNYPKSQDMSDRCVRQK